jgi:CDP-diacylglycerol--glycerol-3-phosphate 3-phosphatidyltransferase
MIDYDEYLRRWSQLHGGYDPATGVWPVRSWLRMIYQTARPLARAGVSPAAVTAAGVAAAAVALAPAAASGRWPALAAALVVTGGLLDNLDGAVAVLTGRDGAWGYVLDSLADRVGDTAFLVALWLLGAPAWLAVAAGAATGMLEYARARAAGAGFDEIGVVTVGERPTRIIACAAALAGAAAVPSLSAVAGTVGALVTLATGAIGLAQLLAVVRPALNRPAQ